MFASHKRDGWLGRRRFLGDAAAGMESIALAWLLNASGAAGDSGTPPSSDAKPATHFAPKARRAIHIFSPGGVSHVDSFDYKPELEKLDGKALSDKGTLDTFFGRPGNVSSVTLSESALPSSFS